MESKICTRERETGIAVEAIAFSEAKVGQSPIPPRRWHSIDIPVSKGSHRTNRMKSLIDQKSQTRALDWLAACGT